MNGLDLVLIVLGIAAVGGLCWVAYSVGRTAGLSESRQAVANQRQLLLSMRRQLDAARVETAELRRAISQARVAQPQPPTWMRATDD